MGWKGVKEGLCALEKNKPFFVQTAFHFIQKSKYSSAQAVMAQSSCPCWVLLSDLK